MERPAWAPAELDLDRPNAARMYDFYLGGSHNFAVDPHGVIGRYASLLPAGSWFVMSHASHAGSDGFDSDRMEDLYRRTPTPVTVRTRAQLETMLADVDLVEPGIAYLTAWRPDAGDEEDDPSWVSTYGAVGRLG